MVFFVLPQKSDSVPDSHQHVHSAPDQAKKTGAGSAAQPVVIKLEIPEGKPEVVKTVVDQVISTLGKAVTVAAGSQKFSSPTAPSSTASPIHVSISSNVVPSASPISPFPNVASHNDDNKGHNKNIPQSLYDSIQQVIAQHLYQQGFKSTTHGTTSTTTTTTTTTAAPETVPPTVMTILPEMTTLTPSSAAPVASSSGPSSIEQIPFNYYYNMTDPMMQWGPTYPQPWFPGPYSPYTPYQYPRHPINQTNQYFPYPTYPFPQWPGQQQQQNYSQPGFNGWYEWAYPGSVPQQQQTSSTPSAAVTYSNSSSISEGPSSLKPMSASSNAYYITVTTTTTLTPSVSTTPSPAVKPSRRIKHKTRRPIMHYDPEDDDIRQQNLMTTVNPIDMMDGDIHEPNNGYINPYSHHRDNLKYDVLESNDDITFKKEEKPSRHHVPSASSQSTGKVQLPSGQLYHNSRLHNNRNSSQTQVASATDSATDKSIPESACTRAGLFQHPNDCNKFYECYYDKFLKKYTLHLFECPVKLAFDSRITGCSGPSDPTVCVQY